MTKAVPGFTVIVPVYNAAPYLRDCLESLLAQSFADWEAICVDDGSTDGSGAILDEYAGRDCRFKVIHQQNAGVSVARNVGLDAAKGEYIAFLDADDMVGGAWLLLTVRAIAEHPGVDWIRTSFRFIDDDQTITARTAEEGGYYTEGRARVEIWRSLAERGEPWCNVFRRDTIGTARFPAGICWREDTCFSALVVANARTFLRIDNMEYLYREVGGSASRRQIEFQTLKAVVVRLSGAWRKAPGERAPITEIILQCLDAAIENGSNYTRMERRDFRQLLVDSRVQGVFSWRSMPLGKTIRWKVFLRTWWTGALTIKKRDVLSWILSGSCSDIGNMNVRGANKGEQ